MFAKKRTLLIILIPVAIFILVSLQIIPKPETANEIVPTAGITNEYEEELVFWEKDRPLTWDDFKAIPDGESFEGALTNVNFSYNWSRLLNTSLPCSYQINWAEASVHVNKSQSWVREPYKNDTYVLEHEQRHFDIGEIHVREFNKKFANELLNKPFPCPDVPAESIVNSIDNEANALLKKIFNDISILLLKMNEDYETQTVHGTNYQKQQEWNNKIDKLLG